MFFPSFILFRQSKIQAHQKASRFISCFIGAFRRLIPSDSRIITRSLSSLESDLEADFPRAGPNFTHPGDKRRGQTHRKNVSQRAKSTQIALRGRHPRSGDILQGERPQGVRLQGDRLQGDLQGCQDQHQLTPFAPSCLGTTTTPHRTTPWPSLGTTSLASSSSAFSSSAFPYCIQGLECHWNLGETAPSYYP